MKETVNVMRADLNLLLNEIMGRHVADNSKILLLAMNQRTFFAMCEDTRRTNGIDMTYHPDRNAMIDGIQVVFDSTVPYGEVVFDVDHDG